MKIKNKHGFIFKIVMFFAKIFKRKPIIYNLNNDKLSNNAIFISNHSAASGPLTISLFFPVFFLPWGTYEMTENYFRRWSYLYHIFYRKKIGYNKVLSLILATLFAIISKRLYKGMQLIPTYPDIRLRRTINNSIKVLEKDLSVLIFPEDSNSGYHEVLLKYNTGFVYLANSYYKKHKVDIPIYPMYFHKKSNSIIIGKKEFIKPLKDSGLNKEDIANYFKDITNNLAIKLFKINDELKNE